MIEILKTICIAVVIATLSGCATTQSSSGSSSGKSFSGTVNNSSFSSFAFTTGAAAPHNMKISSFLALGGFGSIFSGNPVVYPVVMIKDESGNVSSANLVSQTGREPTMFTSAHLESQYSLHLRPNTKYLLLVKAGNSSHRASVKYSNTMSAVGAGTITQNVDMTFSPANSGSVDIQIN